MPYLTPEAPNGDRCIKITVPDTFLPIVRGAIEELLNPHHWEEFGALSIEEALDYVSVLFYGMEDIPGTCTGSGMKYRQFLYEVVAGQMVFLTDEDGYPLFVLLDLE